MKCPSCGSEIPEGSKECFVCGEILGATQSETYNKMYSTPATSASNDISRDVVQGYFYRSQWHIRFKQLT